MKKILLCISLLIGISGILINNAPEVENNEEIDEKRSIFISYIELNKYLNNKDSSSAKISIKEIVNNIYELGFNEIIVQVRSFSDAIYKSEVFPWSRYISSSEGVDPGYDALEEFIKEASRKNISVIAWINPYRIRNTEDISDISHKSPAYTYLESDVVYINNGIYFNPSKDEVVNLIVKGVEEIVKNYKVDGILFDDYFYPDNEIDMKDYDEYLKDNEYISKNEYNLNVVSQMIKKVHDVCEKYGVDFGVSPDGNMENNYNKVFADVKRWCGSSGYIDFIMPQVYYGFNNESKAFKKVIEEWESIILDDSVKLRVALAFYKNGSIDKWAKSGSDEWILNDDIIMREIILSRNLNGYQGFSLFRYDYIFNEENYTEMTVNEIENMKKVLN
ncbi:MAG: family 10 glycosylhydrolase [Bacilli bacterium]|nr:family 10 glycosylhydrolase [Bacilli bacterium]